MSGYKGVYIIAEAGVNHNGSIEMAKSLIDVAVEAGANAVKFQTFKSEKLVSKYAPKAKYQTKTTNELETQLEMLKKFELDLTSHRILIDYCNKKGIQFLSTPFDIDSVELLAHTFNIPYIKIPSGEITNAPLLLKVAHTDKPTILSTGMSTLGEVEIALAVLAFGYTHNTGKPSLSNFLESYYSKEGQEVLQKRVILLHCTTEYPSPVNEVNLKVLDTMKVAFGLPVGYSDHTDGITIPIAAVARGAVVIEKHFTLDKNLPGPDHKASLEPQELVDMIKHIRLVETSLGSSIKIPTFSETKNIPIARKSLVAAEDIRTGEIFSEYNLTIKRPGNGVSPINYWDYLGKTSDKDYKKDEVIQ